MMNFGSWLPFSIGTMTRLTPEDNLHVEERYVHLSKSSLASQSSITLGGREHGTGAMGGASVGSPLVVTEYDRRGNVGSRHRSESDPKSLKAANREKEKVTAELNHMAERLHRAELRNLELRETIERDWNESSGRIAALGKELHSKQFQLDTKIGELESVKSSYAELDASSRRQSEQLQVVKEELRRAEAQHAQTRHLLEERTTELRGAQRFLTQTDSLSGAEVIALAESLNAEILQAAAYMADSLEFLYTPTTTAREEYKEVSRMLGKPMMQVLGSRWEQDGVGHDPTAVQIALQISFVRCSTKIAGIWTRGGRENDNLASIFWRISEKEEQAVSGRWRSMTLAHAGGWDNPDVVTTYMVDAVVGVLTVAGWAQRENKAEVLMGMFRERLSMIVDLTLRLRKGIGEDITSAHISPRRFRPGDAFDPSVMNDTYAGDRRNAEQVRSVVTESSARSGEEVAGTTEMGLQRVVKGHEPEMLLKPKVVLRPDL